MNSPATAMPTRQLLAIIGSLLGGMAAAATIHARVVVPAIQHEVRDMTQAMIDRHEMRPHPQAVSRDEYRDALRQVTARIDRMQSEINHRLDRIEQQVSNGK